MCPKGKTSSTFSPSSRAALEQQQAGSA